MNDTIKKGLIVLGIFLVGTVIGRYSLPTKVVEKEKIVYQEKIVEKIVKVKEINQNTHKTIVKLEKTLVDGTKTVETRITDNSTRDSKENTIDIKLNDTLSTTEKSKETINSRQDTIISLLASSRLENLSTPNFGLMLQKRVIGPIYVGGSYITDRTFGAVLSIGF